ncbi:hypothetical protein [Caproiciproducens galactitolivorans]|uniref:Uncharacterized protein n=1 Tax=Caproiciproducens galactitolivorans TaxID=642589 RepID=A0ABT4BSA4_9FIRM|nr:hypothetical protein [Caproiciproducens galactitolivorans]MCY1713670.1 hypothetical protein [Caproiciproducens galactitolivorans]
MVQALFPINEKQKNILQKAAKFFILFSEADTFYEFFLACGICMGYTFKEALWEGYHEQRIIGNDLGRTVAVVSDYPERA